MITISLCMIVKDEEQTLPRCLDSIRDIADEMIIVDTGSTDRTKELAHRYTKKVLDFQWIDDFSAARNFSFSHATMEYIFWLDADDVLVPEEGEKLKQLKQSLQPNADAVTMPYHCAFDEFGNATIRLRRHRLVKREKNFRWFSPVHEDLDVAGNVLHSDVVITHQQVHGATNRNLAIYENLIRQGRKLSSRDMLHYALELHTVRRFEQAIDLYLAYVELAEAPAHYKFFACDKLADCYHHLGDRDKELSFALKSFAYDIPQPQLCCRIGAHFLQKNEFRKALFWYKLAADYQEQAVTWINDDYPSRTWLPHAQLAYCYFVLEENELSYKHLAIAISYRPDDPHMLKNKEMLEKHGLIQANK
ncbi:MAG: glycosyltransferase family 2 protein [Paenibacillaceae bacterium]|nr:glycosyltransferase family 2 protein [Paenibacillaceae bacterium]